MPEPQQPRQFPSKRSLSAPICPENNYTMCFIQGIVPSLILLDYIKERLKRIYPILHTFCNNMHTVQS